MTERELAARQEALEECADIASEVAQFLPPPWNVGALIVAAKIRRELEDEVTIRPRRHPHKD